MNVAIVVILLVPKADGCLKLQGRGLQDFVMGGGGGGVQKIICVWWGVAKCFTAGVQGPGSSMVLELDVLWSRMVWMFSGLTSGVFGLPMD